MTTQTTRRALIGGAGLAAVVAVAPAIGAANLHSAGLDRSAWDAAWDNHARALSLDRAIDVRHTQAEQSGTLTDALDADWDASGTRLGNAEWSLFEEPAPDFAALDWKLTMLSGRGLSFDDDIAATIIADLRRLTTKGV